nr:retrovirus-related Pol polyprotein from transposon TNT 1-94 [Tanacetum cinerariifolium]
GCACSHPTASSGMVRRAKDTTTYGYDFYNPTLYSARLLNYSTSLHESPEEVVKLITRVKKCHHIQTLDLVYLYGRFVYEDNLISRIYLESKKATITAPIQLLFSLTLLFRISKKILMIRKVKKITKLSTRRSKPKFALLEVGRSNTQPAKPFQSKNKDLVAKTYDWDEEEVISDDEEMFEVRVLMALSNEEKLIFGENHARNDEWVNITMRNRHVR